MYHKENDHLDGESQRRHRLSETKDELEGVSIGLYKRLAEID